MDEAKLILQIVFIHLIGKLFCSRQHMSGWFLLIEAIRRSFKIICLLFEWDRRFMELSSPHQLPSLRFILNSWKRDSIPCLSSLFWAENIEESVKINGFLHGIFFLVRWWRRYSQWSVQTLVCSIFVGAHGASQLFRLLFASHYSLQRLRVFLLSKQLELSPKLVIFLQNSHEVCSIGRQKSGVVANGAGGDCVMAFVQYVFPTYILPLPNNHYAQRYLLLCLLAAEGIVLPVVRPGQKWPEFVLALSPQIPF